MNFVCRPLILPFLASSLCLLSVVCDATADSGGQVLAGSFELPEVSGVSFASGRILFAADDLENKEGFHMIDLLGDAHERLRAGGVIAATKSEQIYDDILRLLQRPEGGELKANLITDLEDAAASPGGEIYLITSHSRSKDGKLPPKRQQFLRVGFEAGTGQINHAALNPSSLLAALPKELAEATTRSPGAKDEQGRYNPGFNIEGLAWAPPDDLLIGLRSPLVESRAVVLRLRAVTSTFSQTEGSSKPLSLEIETRLDLGGMGIRGMCYDEKEKGYWIIAGISPDPKDPDPALTNDWTLWFWNAEKSPVKRWGRNQLPKGVSLENPEAVTVISFTEGAGNALLLVSDDDKNSKSSYVIVPLEKLH